MIKERMHTNQELERQKELDKTFFKRWKTISKEGQKKYSFLYDQINNRVKDNYQEYMKKAFFDSGVMI